LNQNEEGLLDLLDLSVYFGEARKGGAILDNITLQIARGEICGLVGESGAGKTLTALAILGLLPPGAMATGEIRFQGRELLGLTEEKLREIRGCGIGMVFQEPQAALNPVMRIGQQLSEGMRYRLGYSKKKAEKHSLELLHSVGITEPERCLRSYAHQLSGGMRQRVLIASALSCDPELLICDEITSSVDSILEAQLLTLLTRLRRDRRVSILLITHNLSSVQKIADRVSVLLRGRIIEEGPVAAVFEQPSHRFTRTLIDAFPKADA
jgi:ABC-type dipeptide/oligopeptide/nickel transport system ATPase component